MAVFSFDATAVIPSESFDLIPAGDYKAIITESTLKPLKSGGGLGLALTFEVIEGEFKGRKVWAHLNVQHSNPQAQNIAQRDLSAICHAVGVTKLTNTEALHSKPLGIKVKIKPEDGQYAAKNEIKGYVAANTVAAAPVGAPRRTAPAAVQSVAPAAKPAPPWGAKKPAAPAPAPAADLEEDDIPFN